MFQTKLKPVVRSICGHDRLVIGSRVGNCTIQKHYQVDYPQDLN